MIPDFINRRLGKIREICKNYRVNAAYVFGSVLTDKFSDKSDIDLVVDFKREDFHGSCDQFMVHFFKRFCATGRRFISNKTTCLVCFMFGLWIGVLILCLPGRICSIRGERDS